MKKLISLLAAISVVSACSLSAFAMDFTVGDGTLSAAGNADTKIEKGDNQLYNVNLTELAGGQDQTTILAVKGDAITVGSIQYIGQSATPSFSFDLKDELGSDKVYVLAGGSTLTPTVVGYMQGATAPSTFTISGTVTGYAGTTLPTVKIYNGETEVATATVMEGGAFTVDVPVLENGSYALKATKLSHLSYTKGNIASEATVNPLVYPGDIDVSGQADVLDISEIINTFNSKTGDENYALKNDLDESGQTDVLDISEVINNFNKQNISE